MASLQHVPAWVWLNTSGPGRCSGLRGRLPGRQISHARGVRKGSQEPRRRRPRAPAREDDHPDTPCLEARRRRWVFGFVMCSLLLSDMLSSLCDHFWQGVKATVGVAKVEKLLRRFIAPYICHRRRSAGDGGPVIFCNRFAAFEALALCGKMRKLLPSTKQSTEQRIVPSPRLLLTRSVAGTMQASTFPHSGCLQPPPFSLCVFLCIDWVYLCGSRELRALPPSVSPTSVSICTLPPLL